MRWVDALKEWNKGSPTWCIARKGTKAYDEVKAIMAGKKIEAAAEPKAEVAPKLIKIPMEPQRKSMSDSKAPKVKFYEPAPAEKEKAWTAKTRDGKVYKRTIGGVVYLSDYLNQLWLKDPDGSVGDWVGVYLPGENRIDTTASDPYEEVVALPVMKEKQNTSKTELEEELDVGFVYKPAGRRMEQSIFEDIVRMSAEMERAEMKNHIIVRKYMEEVLNRSSPLGTSVFWSEEEEDIWKQAMDILSNNKPRVIAIKTRGALGGHYTYDAEGMLEGYLWPARPEPHLPRGPPSARQVCLYALLYSLRAIDYNPRAISEYDELSEFAMPFKASTLDELDRITGLYRFVKNLPDKFFYALHEIWNPSLKITPKAEAERLENMLVASTYRMDVNLSYEGLSTELEFVKKTAGERYDESKERDKLLEEFETIMKQKGAQVSRDWRKKSNESLQEGIDKMKTYKDKEVSSDDEGERKKLVKEVKELMKQKGKKWAGYTTYSIKILKKGIEDMKAMPDKK